MRWTALFDDLEAQLEAADDAELAAEVADRSRREAALLALHDRLGGSLGAPLTVQLPALGALHGGLRDSGPDWLLLEEPGGREALVPLAAVLGVTGVGPRSSVPGSGGPVARRLDLRWALRGLARSRAGVVVGLSDGSLLPGTLDRVGLDHLDLAEHPAGEVRRPTAVRSVRLVPLRALAVVRSG